MTNLATFKISAVDSYGKRFAVAGLAIPWTSTMRDWDLAGVSGGQSSILASGAVLRMQAANFGLVRDGHKPCGHETKEAGPPANDATASCSLD